MLSECEHQAGECRLPAAISTGKKNPAQWLFRHLTESQKEKAH
jgi:hypothetical protein